jgi:hypothetical protein
MSTPSYNSAYNQLAVLRELYDSMFFPWEKEHREPTELEKVLYDLDESA